MIEAIVAIEEMSDGIGTTDGKLLLKDKEDMKRFVNLTKGKTLICGRKTAETLPESITKYDRKLHIVTGKNLIETKDLLMHYMTDFMIIGGAMTYKTYEDYIDTWHITWFYKQLDGNEQRNLVTYRPELKEYKLMEETFPKPMVRFSTYKRKWMLE